MRLKNKNGFAMATLIAALMVAGGGGPARAGEAGKPAQGKDFKQSPPAAEFMTDISFLPLCRFTEYRGVNHETRQASLLEIPWISIRHIPRRIESPAVKNGENPFTEWSAEAPLVALSQEMHVVSTGDGKSTATAKRDWRGAAPLMSRVVFLNSCLGCLWRDDWWPEGHEYELLNLPLDSRLYLDKQTPRERTIHLGDLVLGAVYKSRRTATLDHRVWGEVPFFTLVTAKREEGARYFTLLDSESTDWRAFYGKTGPWISLFRRESHPADGIRATQILRLPFLGPLWAKYRIQNKDVCGEWAGLLPRLFNRKNFPY